jgi:predicted CXXCH cytochrome family protein
MILYPLLALLGAWLFLMVVMAAAATWYTSRPVFCSSCHNMVPYYESWKKSSHNEVACVECHFPPGIGGKVRGKMLGMVQLLKYVTASAGTRPSAEIPDASCLRSGCHETRLLSGRVDFKIKTSIGKEIVIPFDHTPHMQEGRRGKTLRCTSCHNQLVQGTHMTVTTSTCFLCHFKDEPFNGGLSACTHCHQIPKNDFDIGGGVKFTHELAFKKGVDCVNCHGDLIRGNGDVARDRCADCHNREGDLAKINDHEFIHAKHVTEHHVDCLKCHSRIEHSLTQDKLQHAVADCQSCHPDHHQKQVNILQGAGMKAIAGQSNMMLAIRAECRTCHRADTETEKGKLVRGSLDMCAVCHDTGTVEQFKTYHVALRSALPLLRDSLGKVEAAAKTAGLPAETADKLAVETANMRHDVELLITGNDVHNMHMAAELVRKTVDRLTVLCRELKIEEPKVSLPPALKEAPTSTRIDADKSPSGKDAAK